MPLNKCDRNDPETAFRNYYAWRLSGQTPEQRANYRKLAQECVGLIREMRAAPRAYAIRNPPSWIQAMAPYVDLRRVDDDRTYDNGPRGEKPRRPYDDDDIWV